MNKHDSKLRQIARSLYTIATKLPITDKEFDALPQTVQNYYLAGADKAHNAQYQARCEQEADRDMQTAEEVRKAAANALPTDSRINIGELKMEQAYVEELVERLRMIMPLPVILQEVDASRMTFLYYSEHTLEQSVALFAKYYNNLKEKATSVRRMRSKGEPDGPKH